MKRAKEMGYDYQPDEFPVVFWDLFGEQGHPVRATVIEMGPLLLARLLDLNDTQEGVLNIAFRIADEQHLPLLDLKDLRLLLNEMTKDDGLEARGAALRQRRGRDGRLHPAPAAGAGKPGRRRSSSASPRSTSRTS